MKRILSTKIRPVQLHEPGLAQSDENSQLEQVSMQNFNLPSTLEEFHSKYRLILPQTGLDLKRPIVEVTTIDEVISAVVINVVHSALCVSTEEKTKLIPLLSHVCKSYPRATIRDTVSMIRTKDKMIVHAVQRNKR